MQTSQRKLPPTDPASDDSVNVTMVETKRYSKWEIIRNTVSETLQSRPFFYLWWSRMKVSASFVGQGLVGLLTLGIFMPKFSVKPSVAMGRQMGICNKLREEKNADKSEKDKAKADKKKYSSKDEEKDDFLRRLRNKDTEKT